MRRSTLKDDALFVAVMTGIGLAPAVVAQTTPATYCASLGPTSCEVLNVEIGGMGSNNGVGIVKYCKFGQFKVAPLATCANATETCFFLGSLRLDTYVGSGFPSAASSAQMCGYLP